MVAGPARTGEDRDLDLGPDFVGEILRTNYGIPKAKASRLGEMVLGVLSGATTRWSRGISSRRTVERESIDFILAGIRAFSRAVPNGLQRLVRLSDR